MQSITASSALWQQGTAQLAASIKGKQLQPHNMLQLLPLHGSRVLQVVKYLACMAAMYFTTCSQNREKQQPQPHNASLLLLLHHTKVHPLTQPAQRGTAATHCITASSAPQHKGTSTHAASVTEQQPQPQSQPQPDIEPHLVSHTAQGHAQGL